MKAVIGVLFVVSGLIGLVSVLEEIVIDEAMGQESIPGWVKGVAGFWAEGKISDLEFVNAMEFLIGHGLIQVNDRGHAGSTVDNNEDYCHALFADAFDYLYDLTFYAAIFDHPLSAPLNAYPENFNFVLKDDVADLANNFVENKCGTYRYLINEDDYLKVQTESLLYNLGLLEYNQTGSYGPTSDGSGSLIEDGQDMMDFILKQHHNSTLPSNILNLTDGMPSELKPSVTMEHTEISWEFFDSKGNQYGMVWPVSSFETIVKQSAEFSYHQTYIDPLYLEDPNTRTSFPILNLNGFVQGDAFECCVDDIYHNSHSNTDFIYEIWWIISKLTVYDEDVDASSSGRFALETFARGGGDCEDLVILIAEMLKSSKFTSNWDMQYVYMDSENPTHPMTVDHVILYVHDGEYSYYIEATGPPSWDYYPDGVDGWWFDV